MSDEELLDFKSVVEMFNITPRTLRYYEDLELIAPKREGRARFYSKREIARIKLILRGRRFGFKLEEIRQLLELYDPQSGNQLQMKMALEKSEESLEALRSRREELDEVISEMEAAQQELRKNLERSG